MKTRNTENFTSSRQAWKGIPRPASLKLFKKINFWNLFPHQSHQPVSTHYFLLFLQKLILDPSKLASIHSHPIFHPVPLCPTSSQQIPIWSSRAMPLVCFLLGQHMPAIIEEGKGIIFFPVSDSLCNINNLCSFVLYLP